MIAWEALFDAIHISWRTSGANCSRGHINCRCPWCGNLDPSYHLTISRESGAYFCLRTPGKLHSGRSLPWLLLGLGVEPHDIDGLIEEHTDRRAPPQLLATPARILDWDRFQPAADEPAAIEYLRERGYRDPRNVAARFGLRFTRTGRFAWRLLIPLYSPGTEGSILAFTGRSIRGQIPRYLTNDPINGSLFAPWMTAASTALWCEGPMDAIPVAMASVGVMPVALLGTAMTAEKKLHIGTIARRVGRHFYVPDADQSISNTYRLIAEMEEVPGVGAVERLPLPAGFKDIGEMAGNELEIQTWLQEALSKPHISQSGGVHSRTTRAATSAATPGG